MLNHIRNEFPILQQQINGHPLAYLDSAATTQKPNCVIQAISNYYSTFNANVHRGIHTLSAKASAAFEESREYIAKFINAKSSSECIFVRSTTEAINLVANTWGEMYLEPFDEIVISALEHHSNIVPWQMLCQRKKAILKIIPMNERGELILDSFDTLLTEKTKLLAITHVSNALGTVNPVQEITKKAKAKNITVLIDGAQAAPHLKLDMQALDCDFYAFSGHKMYGPTGIGVLYGKSELLNTLPPYQGGGDMILKVTHASTVYQEIPYKFEAGTPPIAEVIGLHAALKFLSSINFDFIKAHESQLMQYALESLRQISGIHLLAPQSEKVGVISFNLDGIHAHDVGTILDQYGVAVRSGHHCSMPTMDFLNIPASVRVSLGIYNNEQDIDQCIKALKEVNRLFKRNMSTTHHSQTIEPIVN